MNIMNRTITPSPARTLKTERGELSVLIVYEDHATRDRAMSTRDSLVRKHWADFEFNFSWWKFAYLRDSAIAAAAASAAASANVVIFSAHVGKELPPVVKSWVEKWASKREGQKGALVALIGTPEDVMTPTHYYLRNVAVRTKMDYLPPAANVPSSLQRGLDRSLDCTAKTIPA